jgi:hypothetical protein
MSRPIQLRVKGLPGPLPAGERLLWQGAPDWRALALRVMHVRKLAVYFAALLVWYAASKLAVGMSASEVAVGTAKLTAVALAPLAMLIAYSWGVQRTTLYTVTSRRIIIKCGIALPMTVNLPFARIDGAAVKAMADGSGDIALTVARDDRVSYVVLWPNVRPWRLGRTQPALRCLADVARVGQIVGRAMAVAADVPVRAAPVARPQAANGAHAAATA